MSIYLGSMYLKIIMVGTATLLLCPMYERDSSIVGNYQIEIGGMVDTNDSGL